jgi:Holliday junction resolvase RusA-like endonuclease
MLAIAVDYEVMPHPRQIHNKAALSIARNVVRNRAVARTMDYLANRDGLAWLLKAHARPVFPDRTPLKAKISIWRTGERLADADNLAKTVLDAAVTAGWISDDRWVRSLSVEVFDQAIKNVVAVKFEPLKI